MNAGHFWMRPGDMIDSIYIIEAGIVDVIITIGHGLAYAPMALNNGLRRVTCLSVTASATQVATRSLNSQLDATAPTSHSCNPGGSQFNLIDKMGTLVL